MKSIRSSVNGALVSVLKRLGLPTNGLRSNWRRMQLARKHLRGVGIEIGAMHNPLRVPASARVEYLDVTTREENIRKFPELDAKALVHVDHLANGFLMDGMASSRFDFLIANHVLEHASNPVGALVQWCRVLKPGGIVFCALPKISMSFDRDRALTTVEHMLEDYQHCENNDHAAMKARNLDHYREWLCLAIPAHTGLAAPEGQELAQQLSACSEREDEIHFHTFTLASALALLARVGERIVPGLQVVDAADGRAEIVLILQKPGAAAQPRI